MFALFDLRERRIDESLQLNNGGEPILSPEVGSNRRQLISGRQRHDIGVQCGTSRLEVLANLGKLSRTAVELKLQRDLVAAKLRGFTGQVRRLRAGLDEKVDEFSITGAQQVDDTKVLPSSLLQHFGSSLRIGALFSLKRRSGDPDFSPCERACESASGNCQHQSDGQQPAPE